MTKAPLFQKRQLEFIADVIADLDLPQVEKNYIIRVFSTKLSATNPLFRPATFEIRSGIEGVL